MLPILGEYAGFLKLPGRRNNLREPLTVERLYSDGREHWVSYTPLARCIGRCGITRNHVHSAAAAERLRWSKRRSNTCSAMRFFSISIEPPAIIQPRVRRMQYSTSVSRL
jgi:hypothetical protein